MISPDLLLVAYLFIYVAGTAADLWITRLNAAHAARHGGEVPPAFSGVVDKEALSRMNQYTLDKTRFGILHAVVTKTLFLLILLSGLLPWLTGVLGQVPFIPAGLIFFAVPGLILSLADLPFGYYRTFVIEEKYGFNTRTLRIWITDLIKAALLSVAVGGLLLVCLLAVLRYMGAHWWLWSCAVYLGFQILMTLLYPTLIAPLFNTFRPIRDPDLAGRIGDLARGEGIDIEGIFEMDASRRSRHTNAYFTGLGKTKRIVLFDSLLHSHTEDEILAVLAHEIGHFKRHHIKKQLLMVFVAAVTVFFLASMLISWETLYQAFRFSGTPAYAGLFLVAVLLAPAGFLLAPAALAVSRSFEREADQYALRLMQTPSGLVKALKKLARDNLSNLTPHPLYVWFNGAHPPLLERITELESAGSQSPETDQRG
jgi:STE24 endopeptidase